jgi:DNA-binding beta-propeller fold protein YncE
VRRIGADGKIMTVAGVGADVRDQFRRPGFSGDGGPAVLAHLNQPVSAALDAGGNLYIADTGNQRIRKVNAQGVIGTVAGIGLGCFSGEGRAAAAASLNEPAGIAADALGNIYVADTANRRIRKITPAGAIVTLAGDGGIAPTGDGGAATAATLNQPEGVALDASSGDLYIADTGNNRVRKAGADGVIRTVAGTGAACFNGDEGLAADAALTRPRGVAVDSGGALLIVDGGNSRVRRVDSQGVVTRVFGADPREVSADKALTGPWAVAVDGDGRVYIAEAGTHRVRVVNVGGSSAVIAKGLNRPSGLAWDPDAGIQPKGGFYPDAGLYIADTGNQVVRRLDSGGNLSIVAGTGARGFSGDGGPAAKAELNAPMGLAVDGAGNLYIADQQNHRIRRVSPGGSITTVAGRGAAGFSGDHGPAAEAALNRPSAVAVDAFGNLYIADTMNGRIRKVALPDSISAAPPSLDLGAALSPSIRLRASNPALRWEAKPTVPWLKLSAMQGAFPATVTVSTAGALPPGEHRGMIEFNCPGGPNTSVAVLLRKE